MVDVKASQNQQYCVAHSLFPLSMASTKLHNEKVTRIFMETVSRKSSDVLNYDTYLAERFQAYSACGRP